MQKKHQSCTSCSVYSECPSLSICHGHEVMNTHSVKFCGAELKCECSSCPPGILPVACTALLLHQQLQPLALIIYMNEGVTNNEVSMEFNSAYQSVEVAEAESKTMEFTPSDYI